MCCSLAFATHMGFRHMGKCHFPHSSASTHKIANDLTCRTWCPISATRCSDVFVAPKDFTSVYTHTHTLIYKQTQTPIDWYIQCIQPTYHRAPTNCISIDLFISVEHVRCIRSSAATANENDKCDKIFTNVFVIFVALQTIRRRKEIHFLGSPDDDCLFRRNWFELLNLVEYFFSRNPETEKKKKNWRHIPACYLKAAILERENVTWFCRRQIWIAVLCLLSQSFTDLH